MVDQLKIKMYACTLDCKEPLELARFYAALLEWVIPFQDEEYVCLSPPGVNQGAYPCLTFQRNPAYLPPVWPETPEAQQQMAHLDFAVNNLEKAVEHAIRCGATVADRQFTDAWRVMFDPAGHPFCLCYAESLYANADFALL